MCVVDVRNRRRVELMLWDEYVILAGCLSLVLLDLLEVSKYQLTIN